MLLSIDICGDIVYIVEGSVSSGTVEVRKCDEAKLPRGTVDDGDIKNQAALVMTLSKLLAARSYKSGSAVVTFTSNSVLSRRFDLPVAKPREITSMVKNQMVQAVNDPTDYVFEYSSTYAVSKDNTIVVWAYALEKNFIDKYYSVIKSVKLNPAALDIHSNCVEKLLLNATVNDDDMDFKDRSVLLVDIEQESIEIHLISGGQRAFSRVSPVSASEFLMIAENLGYGNTSSLNHPVGSFVDKEGQQNKQVVNDAWDGLDISPETLESDSILAETARQYTGKVADELNKMIQFQLRRDTKSPVSCIYTYGSFSGIKGFSSTLSQALSCTVETIDSVSNVKIEKSVRIGKYINAIGALIRL